MGKEDVAKKKDEDVCKWTQSNLQVARQDNALLHDTWELVGKYWNKIEYFLNYVNCERDYVEMLITTYQFGKGFRMNFSTWGYHSMKVRHERGTQLFIWPNWILWKAISGMQNGFE